MSLTKEEALKLIVDGNKVHTFINAPEVGLIGADWDRQELLKKLDEAESITLAGEIATKMHHGVVIHPKRAKYQRDLIFVETKT